MKYNVHYYSKIKNCEHELVLVRNINTITVKIDGKEKFMDSIDIFQKLFKEYNSQQLNGVDYKGRALTKKILPDNSDIALRNIFRAFAITENYLIYSDNTFYNLPIFAKHIIETFNNNCFHSSLIDWTGELGAQPVLYYLKKDYITKSEEQIRKLYDKGLLGKIKVEIDEEELSNYFIPLELPNVNNFMLIGLSDIWKKLINDMKDELSKLNKE